MVMVILWLIVTIASGILEALTVGLVSIWFAFGGFAALIASNLHCPVFYQYLIFIAVSLLTMVLIRPFAKKKLKVIMQATNVDSLVGIECIVTEDINNLSNKGEVQIKGQRWSAQNIEDRTIAKNSRVVVERIEGVKLIVKEISN